MTTIPDNIRNFAGKQTCASVCCVDEEGKPWCFSCFYAFDAEEGMIYFKSTAQSTHAAILKTNPRVAGTVLPDKLNKLIIKGLQFEGTVLAPEHPLLKKALAIYHTKHPLAMTMAGEVWAVRLDHIKMTDSTLGFGKKITWTR